MDSNENRRRFLQKFGLMSLAAGTGGFFPARSFAGVPSTTPSMEKSDLVSLPASEVFKVLDLDRPELATVRKALEKKGHDAALAALLKYYRKRYPKPQLGVPGDSSAGSIKKADNLRNHIFQWGPYPPADYGEDIDWAADPAGDIEWVAAVYRFYWATELANAYKATGNEGYVQTFVELASDWIAKHPLEETVDKVHPVYGPRVYGSGGWKGFAWLDLQTGIRATSICASFRTFLHAESFTPQFLGLLLASLYDHQVKTEKMPMAMVHNKAIFEQRGFFNVIHTFPEFADKDRWLGIAIGITTENLLAQTTTDGVQREWCGGYHSGVYRDALEIWGRVTDLGRSMPDYYVDRVRAMADHIFGISTPELGFPMFGDTGRRKKTSDDRRTWQLYGMLVEAGQKFNDPKFRALADLDVNKLPDNGSIAFEDAGLYVMRNKWSPDQVYMALHCSTPAISNHDTPDNGTFELYAYGRWLMPDSGFYTYGHDREARNWHRQTKVHPTMTMNGKDTAIMGRQLHWNSGANQDLVCFENHSYSRFIHRRTVWLVNKSSDLPFFVIFDEAIGDNKGDLAIHFPMAPGTVHVDQENGRILTGFDDANILIQVAGQKPIRLEEEEGWHAWSYGNRERRTSVSAVYTGQAPFTFVSVLLPFQGTNAPSCKLHTDPASLIVGKDPVELEVEVAGQKHRLSRRV